MACIVGIDHPVIWVSNYKRSRVFDGKLFTFLGIEISDEYEDMIDWTNGKTRFWIGHTDEQGKRRKYLIDDVDFHYYAFELYNHKHVDASQAFLRNERHADIVYPDAEYSDGY
jgi:hypothetical protein